VVLTPEHKEKLIAGRKAAAERRKAEATAKAAAPYPVLTMPPIVHEGEITEADMKWADIVVDRVEGGPAEPEDDFERFLASQDAETRNILTDVELRVIYEVETKRAADERRATLKKTVAAKALRHARASAGLIGPEAVATAALLDRLSQKVTWTVNMPEAGNSGTLIDEGVRINGRLLQHGTQVTGTLGEYISYREIEYRAHENERQFQGRSRMSRLSQTGMRFLHNEGQA
jgi:hypothetical protein